MLIKLLRTALGAIIIFRSVAGRANDIEPGLDRYSAVRRTINVDGDLSDWDGIPMLKGTRFFVPKGAGSAGALVAFESFGGIWNGPDDQTVAFGVTWDEGNLYLAIIVTDDSHENSANSTWNGDSLQLMIADGARHEQIALYNYALGGTDQQLGGVIVDHESGPGGTQAAIRRSVQKRETYYEIRFPAASVAQNSFSAGRSLGLGFILNESDDEPGQIGQKGWSGWGAHAIVYGKTPSETGLVTLATDPTVSRYKLTATTLGGGSITLDSPNGEYASNTVARITAVPEPGWIFLNWKGDNASSQPTIDLTVKGPTSLEAVFGTFLLLQGAAGGSITVSPSQNFYPFGTDVTLTAVPFSNQYFFGWGDALSGTDNPMHLNVNRPNLRVSASFVPRATQIISFGPISDRVLGDPPIALVATSNSGRPVFFSVSGPAELSGNILRIINAGTVTVRAVVEGDNSLYAASVTRSFNVRLRLSLTIGLGGNVSQTSEYDPINYPHGKVRLTAEPGGSQAFLGWTGDITSRTNPLTLVLTTNYLNIKANFGNGYQLRTNVSGQGSITVEPLASFYAPGDEIKVNAIPLSGSTFASWSGALTGSNPVARLVMDSDKAITASFVPGFRIAATTPGGGTVSLDSPNSTYPGNSVATIAATPSAGWTFLGWSGDADGSNPVLNLRVDGNKTLQAIFGTSVSLVAEGPGTLTATPSQPLYAYGASVTIIADPGSNSFFREWQGAAIGTNTALKLNVTAPNLVVSGVFVEKQSQAIQFGDLQDRPLNDSPFLLSAMSSSGLPVSFSIVSGPATLAGNSLTITGMGTIALKASQSGNQVYQAASDVLKSFHTFSTVSVTTIAGTGVAGFRDAVLATEGRLNAPDGPCIAADGTIYFADTGNDAVRFISSDGSLGTLAGGGKVGYFDAAGTNALFSFPLSAYRLRSGDFLVTDAENDVIRRISGPIREVTTFSGLGARGYSNGDPKVARYAFPNDLVEGSDGAIYVTEFLNHTVRKVFPDGSVISLAGGGIAGYRDGTGTAALFNQPAGIAADIDGTLYVTEWSGHRVRKITTQGIVTTVAGNGVAGYNNGPAATAQFNSPNGITVGRNHELYLTDNYNHAIRRITTDGVVSTVAGLGHAGFSDGDESAALFSGPSGIALAPDGSLIVTDGQNNRLRRIKFHQKAPTLSMQLTETIVQGKRWAFQMSIKGEISSKVRIELSHDLKSWLPVKSVVLGSSGPFQLTGVIEDDSTFYRVVGADETLPL